MLVGSAGAVMLPAGPAGAAVKTINAVAPGGVGHWQPAATTAGHGITIHWHAVSGHHTVTAYGGNWTFNKALALGATVSKVFPTKGVFRFYCRVHGYLDAHGVCHLMCGRITIT